MPGKPWRRGKGDWWEGLITSGNANICLCLLGPIFTVYFSFETTEDRRKKRIMNMKSTYEGTILYIRGENTFSDD